ncbi:hypothetical protein Hena1_02120 [Erwinia phage Hena1]|jgi:hypothetical protein|uniref:Uncharacterized protein n=1 Tax=Erwinia phage Hena1 TaxID=2678601 RepID=A0A6B9JCJ7_9CAUD|nr:hypothetical protein HWC84_gp152 [Erwinia phage Hena1]QGZ16362.1 hypothetical protein Hena1_02120 [Erwinia phage Hena1]
MALIVSTTRATSKGGKLSSKCETLIFLNEDEGREFVKKNKGLVFHVQKGTVTDEQRSD